MRRHLPLLLMLVLAAPLCAAPSVVRQVGVIIDSGGMPSPVPFTRFVDVMIETLAGSRQWEPTVLTEDCPLIGASGAPWPQKADWSTDTDTLRALLVATRLSDLLVVTPVPATANTISVLWLQGDQSDARRLQFMTAGSGDSSYAALTNQLMARLNLGFSAVVETPTPPLQPATPTPAAPTAPTTVVAAAGNPATPTIGHETVTANVPKAQPQTQPGAVTLTGPEVIAAAPTGQPSRPETSATSAAQPAPEPVKPEAPVTAVAAAPAPEAPTAPLTPAAVQPPTTTPAALPAAPTPVAQPGQIALMPPAVTTGGPTATATRPEAPSAQPAPTALKTPAPAPIAAVTPDPAAPETPIRAAVAPQATTLPAVQPAPVRAPQPGAVELTRPETTVAHPDAQPARPEAPAAQPTPGAVKTELPATPVTPAAPVVPVTAAPPTAQAAPPVTQPKPPSQFLVAADKAMAEGDFKKVEDMLLRAAEADDPKADVFYAWARLEAARQNRTAERTWLERTLGVDPTNYPAHLRLAGLLQEAGLWRKAVDEYGVVLKGKPDSVQAYLGLATVYAGQAQPKRAADTITEALKHAPTDFSLYLRLGDLQTQRNALAEAESAYDRAARLTTGATRADALDRLGDLYVGAQRDHEGFICYAEAATLRNTGTSALADKRYKQIMAAADHSLTHALQQAAQALQSYLSGGDVTREEAFAAMSDFNTRAQEVSKFAESITAPTALKLQHAERKLTFSLASEAALYGLLYLDQARPQDLDLYQSRINESYNSLQLLQPKG